MRGRALLITCGSYDDPRIRPLRSPALDGRLLAGVLSTPGIGLFDEQDVDTLPDPTSTVARQRINDLLRSAQTGETVLIYYSGHGLTYQDSIHNLFLTTRDTDRDQLLTTSVDTGFINTAVAGMAKTVRVVLLIDACSAGAHQVDPTLTTQLYVIGAVAADREAPDGTTEEPSPFAVAVARTLLGLETPGTDPVTVDDVYDALRRLGDRVPFRSAISSGTVELTALRTGTDQAGEENFRRELQFARFPEARHAKRAVDDLTDEAREACRDMQVVPEDSPVSERWVTAWWGSPDGRHLSEPEKLLEDLIDRRLVEVTVPARKGHGRLVALRKPARAILSVGFTGDRRRQAYDSMVSTARGMLLPAGEPEAWWLLPAEPETLWGRMPRHLENAGRTAEADRLRCDPRWIALRIRRTGSVTKVLGELDKISRRTPDAARLHRHLLRARHLIDPVARRAALTTTLLSRLVGCEALIAELRGPRLTAEWPLPDVPHPAQLVLIRPAGAQTVPLATTPAIRWLVTAGPEGIGRWDPTTGDPLPSRTDPAGGTPHCCAVTTDGQFVAVGGEQGVRLHTLPSGEPADDDTTARVGRVRACAGGEGRLLVAGSDNIARLLTLTEHGRVSQDNGATVELLGHSDVVNCCSMRGDVLATGSDDWTVRLWTPEGESHGEPLDADGAVLCCVLTPHGDRVIGGTDSGAVVEWNTEGSGPQPLYRHTGAVRCATVDPAGRWVATGGEDGTVRVAPVTGGLGGSYGKPTILSGHRGAVTQCAVASDGSWLATAGDDGTIRIWDPFVRETHTPTIRTEPARFCVPAHGGEWFLTGGPGRALHRWDRNEPDAPAEVWDSRVTAAAISADDRLLLVGTSDGLLRLFVGTKLTHTFPAAGAPITACHLADDGSWLAAGLLTGEIVVHSLLDDSAAPTRHIVDRSLIRALAESPEGRLVVFSRRGTRAIVNPHDTAAGIIRHAQNDQVHAAQTSPDAFVLTRTDGSIAGGSLAAVPIVRPFTPESSAGPLRFVAAAVDRAGNRLVTADTGRSVRVWDADGRQMAEFPSDQDVTDCRWLDDSTVVAVGDAGVHLLTFHES
ncbi:caspase family protein [Actinoplanes sp. HUAS TT8]|uniref:caspase family protein n=1 Tax=Actinoplanes sp. HUAS TT8 TaxID=3447453 RepID=UPI003F525453